MSVFPAKEVSVFVLEGPMSTGPFPGMDPHALLDPSFPAGCTWHHGPEAEAETSRCQSSRPRCLPLDLQRGQMVGPA